MTDKRVELMMGRDYVLRSTSGHTIRFKAGKSRPVHPRLVDEAMRFGAFPPDPEVMKALQEKKAAAEKKKGVVDGERDQVIRDQILKMMDRNGREDFNGSGRPDLKVIKAETGLDVSGKERDRIHNDIREKASEANA